MILALLLIGLACMPLLVSAHAFGASYSLPLPTELYVFGGSFALIVSFVVLAFSPHRAHTGAAGKIVFGIRTTEKLVAALRFGAVAVLVASIVLGVLGPEGAVKNFAPIAFWIYLLLGFAYVSVFVGGLWERINPFAVGFGRRTSDSPVRKLPAALSSIPAIGLYALLIYIELLTNGAGAVPRLIAFGLLAYWLISAVIIDIYGKDAWEKQFDVFSVLFALMSSFAPLAFTERGVERRAPFSLAGLPRVSLGTLAFVIVMLAFTAFDGFKETRPYAELMIPLAVHIPFWILELCAFVIAPALFFGIYALCIYALRVLAKLPMSIAELMREYALSLLPIAIVYHAAHYFPLLIAEGQRIIAIVSDPFGLGWNLFGTASFVPNPGIIGADVMWYIQLVLIVGGHIAALYVSHLITHRLIVERRRAILAEFPMLAVMVFYTAFGLWILAQPFAL